MASYCIHCGDRQAYSQPHSCRSCTRWATPFDLDDESFGRLWRASIKTVIEDIGIPEITWNSFPATAGPDHISAASWYDPTPPGHLALSLSRPPEEVCLSLIHEMGHAMLWLHHASEYPRHPRREELIVNGAADIICRRYVIRDYVPRMKAIGLRACRGIEELSVAARTSATHVAGQLLEIIDRHSATDTGQGSPNPALPLS